MFSRSNDSMKGKYRALAFISKKKTKKNKVSLLYLECKLQEDTYDWCIFKLNWEEKV